MDGRRDDAAWEADACRVATVNKISEDEILDNVFMGFRQKRLKEVPRRDTHLRKTENQTMENILLEIVESVITPIFQLIIDLF